MLIGDDHSPSLARDFCTRWPKMLEARLVWFAAEVECGEPEVGALDGLVRLVVDRIGEGRFVESVPEWFDEALADVGWSAYGAALAEGLMAYVAEIFASRLESPLPWIMESDPRSAYHLKPVVDQVPIAPPWRQVMGVLRLAQSGGDPSRLRSMVEFNLLQMTRESDQHDVDEPLVEVVPDGSDRWQVSFPEDVDERLGERYADLEDVLAAVDGVTEAIMEDRDRALLTTGSGVDQASLEQRITEAVEALVAADG